MASIMRSRQRDRPGGRRAGGSLAGRTLTASREGRFIWQLVGVLDT